MKNIYFKRKDSVLRSLQEEKRKAKASKINWDRIIYLILLSVFLFVVGRYAFIKIYYVKAEGQILFKNLNVQNLEDCRIIKFNVVEGSEVKVGDTLFFYTSDNAIVQGGDHFIQSEVQNLGKSSPHEKAIYEVEEELANSKQDYEHNFKQKQVLAQELKQISQEVLLEALPKSMYFQKEAEYSKIVANLEVLKQRSSTLADKLSKLKGLNRNTLRSSSLFIEGKQRSKNEGIQAFKSPMDGVITKIFKENQEVALKSEIIMYLQKSENVFIKGFFEQKDLKYLKTKSVVDIEFPDGTESSGIIQRYYFSTYRLPEEFQRKYEPTTRSLSVDILPLNSKEFNQWQKFYKLSVTIRKSRFQW